MVPVTPAFAAFLAGRSAATLTIAPGIQTPLRFSDTPREHLATRQAAGLFDFSFMGCIEVAGADSRALLEFLQTRALAGLPRGRIAYTLMLREDASVLIDATVWHLDHHRYWLFCGRRSDLQVVTDAARAFDVTLTDWSERHAVIAVQGTASRRVIEHVLGRSPIAELPYFAFTSTRFGAAACWLARIGYSGEAGYELVIADDAAPALWEALLAAGRPYGLRECGFDAVNSLRIEAGHILFTRELAGSVTPAQLGLARLVDNYRSPFRGAAAMQAQRWRPPAPRLVGLLPVERGTVCDMRVQQNMPAEQAVITSRCWSPVFGRDLALGFVRAADAWPGTVVKLAGGARARVARLPFYDPARALPRRAP